MQVVIADDLAGIDRYLQNLLSVVSQHVESWALLAHRLFLV